MKSSQLLIKAALLIVLSSLFVKSHPLNILPNQYWTCVLCGTGNDDKVSSTLVFGAIRNAIHTEQRNIYFTLETSWLDTILLPESKVNVTLIEPQQLSQSRILPVLPLPKSPEEEVFQIAVADVSGIPGDDIDGHISDVDEFLKINPCWLPLYGTYILGICHAHFNPRLVAKQMLSEVELI
jgi:hypothetical protein